MKTLYATSATATSGRQGRVLSDDPALDLSLVSPKSLGGPGGDGTNPEQLFAAGYAACFGSALGMVARRERVDAGDFSITGHVALGTKDDGKYSLAVELVGDFPALDQEKAEGLMHAAHEVCPYSNATRGNIEVKLSVKEGRTASVA